MNLGGKWGKNALKHIIGNVLLRNEFLNILFFFRIFLVTFGAGSAPKKSGKETPMLTSKKRP